MKKKYEKPLISYEDFCLSENIASGCSIKSWAPSQYACPYLTPSGHQVFMSPIAACTTREEDGEHNGICYHVPMLAYTLFTS